MVESDFLTQIDANPTDYDLRRVYADWIEDQPNKEHQIRKGFLRFQLDGAQPKDWPIRKVDLTDKLAMSPPEVRWYLRIDSIGPVDCDDLDHRIFEQLKGGKIIVRKGILITTVYKLRDYQSRTDAVVDLSQACVAYAKGG